MSSILARGGAALALLLLVGPLAGQILPPGVSLVRTYDNATLATPGPLGGIDFSADGATLYVGGNANSSSGVIHALPVTRDASGRITNLGPGVQFAPAANVDGGVQFGPGGTLFWTRYSNNALGQRTPAGTTASFDLGAAGVASSVGGLEFVPAGLPNAGELLVSSYNAGDIFTVPLTPNGDGTYTPVAGGATLFASLPFGTEGIRHIPSGPNAGSMVVANYSIGALALLRINLATGRPILLPNGDPDFTVFLQGVANAEGVAFDPMTNDFFVSTYGNGNRIFHFSGFPGQAPIVAPATWSVSSGQPIQLPIDLGTGYAGSSYAVLVGGSGNMPGLSWGNTVIPLEFDALTTAVLDQIALGAPQFQGFLGNLDAQGQALAVFDPFGPLPPAWAGVAIDFCLVATPPEFASLPAHVDFVP